MRGVVISRPGGPEVLVLQEDLEAPALGPHDVLIRVMATAVNRADLLQRRGGYPPPAGAPAAVPGLEYSGVVDRCGERVTRWKEGDRVMGIVPGGGYAEQVAVNEGEALPIPARLT
jgi:NADPH:quinone reductase